MLSIGVLADDLTSATDTAVAFHAAGYKASVTLNPNSNAPLTTGHLLSFDKDSRARDAVTAAHLSALGARFLRDADLLVHTVDSTLRGHLAVEIHAALQASGRSLAVLAPAFPGAGRTTLDGVQLLHGRPLQETPFALDPVHPIRDARIASRLEKCFAGAIRHLGLSELHDLGPEGLSCSARVVVADAIHREDLDRIVAAFPDPARILWCGSPGLSEALARRVRLEARSASISHGARRFLIVAGSLNPVTLEQVKVLEQRRPVRMVTVDPMHAVIDPAGAAESACDRSRGVPSVTGDAVVHVAGMRAGDGAASIARAIGLAARHVAANFAPDALILTGGDTARAVLGEFEIQTLRLVGELMAGVPIAIAEGSSPYLVVTKAGGFGDAEALVRCVDAFRDNQKSFTR